jgi:hypothetical protein
MAGTNLRLTMMMVWRGGEWRRDNNEDYIDEDDNDYDVGWGSGPVKRRRVAMLMTLADDHVLEDDNLCQDSNETRTRTALMVVVGVGQ